MNNQSQIRHPIPAVRALIINTAERILILKRSNTDYGSGKWCLPGGKVDYNQTVETALAAEINEELSVQLISCEFFYYQDSLPVEPQGLHFINFYFRCTIQGDPALNEESSDLAWISATDMPRYPIVFRNDEAIKRYFQERDLRSLPVTK